MLNAVYGRISHVGNGQVVHRSSGIPVSDAVYTVVAIALTIAIYCEMLNSAVTRSIMDVDYWLMWIATGCEFGCKDSGRLNRCAANARPIQRKGLVNVNLLSVCSRRNLDGITRAWRRISSPAG